MMKPLSRFSALGKPKRFCCFAIGWPLQQPPPLIPGTGARLRLCRMPPIFTSHCLVRSGGNSSRLDIFRGHRQSRHLSHVALAQVGKPGERPDMVLNYIFTCAHAHMLTVSPLALSPPSETLPTVAIWQQRQ